MPDHGFACPKCGIWNPPLCAWCGADERTFLHKLDESEKEGVAQAELIRRQASEEAQLIADDKKLGDALAETLTEVDRTRGQQLEAFARSFFEKSGLDPMDVELVEDIDRAAGQIKWHFRKKEEER